MPDQNGVLRVQDIILPDDFCFVEEDLTVDGPTCTICSDCCMCETGGV
jgi:hypothetical protein